MLDDLFGLDISDLGFVTLPSAAQAKAMSFTMPIPTKSSITDEDLARMRKDPGSPENLAAMRDFGKAIGVGPAGTIMTQNQKIAIGVAGVAAIGIVAFLLYRSRQEAVYGSTP